MLAAFQEAGRDVDLVGLVAQSLDRRASGDSAVKRELDDLAEAGRSRARERRRLVANNRRCETALFRPLGRHIVGQPQDLESAGPMRPPADETAILESGDPTGNAGMRPKK